MASAFGKTFTRIAPILMNDFIKELGLIPVQAAGFVGNFGAESGLVSGQQEGKPIGTVYPIRGFNGGIDWPQWTGWGQGGRRKAFAEFVESQGLPYPSYKASWEFVKHELRTSHAKALRQVKLTTSVKAAAETAEAYYEIAGIKRMGSRIQAAEEALRLWKASSQPAPAPPSPAPPTPVPPMPTPPAPLPDSKPWWQSKTVLINIATFLASTPLFAKYFGGMDVSALAETLSTVAVLLGPILSSVFRVTAAQPIEGTPLSKQIEAAREAEFAPAQPPQESWRYDEPQTIQHVTDHNEVVRLATQLPWPEFAALAIKLTPMLLVAKEAAQKVVEQRPPRQPSNDPLDILRPQE